MNDYAVYLLARPHIYDPFNEIAAKVSALYPCWNDVAPRRSLQPFELPWCCGPVLAVTRMTTSGRSPNHASVRLSTT